MLATVARSVLCTPTAEALQPTRHQRAFLETIRGLILWPSLLRITQRTSSLPSTLPALATTSWVPMSFKPRAYMLTAGPHMSSLVFLLSIATQVVHLAVQ